MKRTLVLAFVLALVSPPLFAGQVSLKSGDRITGEVTELKAGKFVFKTPHGDLTIPQAEVVSLSMKEAMLVGIGEAPPKSGKIRTDPGGDFEWEGKKVSLADVTAILPPPSPPKALTELKRWSGNIGLAVTWTDGNTHILNYHGELNLLRDQSRAAESFKNKLNINLKYDYGKSGGEQIKRQGFGGTKWDLFLHPRIGAYVEGSWFYDFEAGIDRKNTLGVGFSAKVIEGKDFKLNFDLGVSYMGTFYTERSIREAVAAGATPVEFEEYPAMRVMIEAIWKLPLDFDVHHKTVMFESLEDPTKYNLESETSVSRKITKAWFFRLSALFKYIEPPAPGKLRWDSTYILSVVFKF